MIGDTGNAVEKGYPVLKIRGKMEKRGKHARLQQGGNREIVFCSPPIVYFPLF